MGYTNYILMDKSFLVLVGIIILVLIWWEHIDFGDSNKK
jgi:hypothetical protein